MNFVKSPLSRRNIIIYRLKDFANEITDTYKHVLQEHVLFVWIKFFLVNL